MWSRQREADQAREALKRVEDEERIKVRESVAG